MSNLTVVSAIPPAACQQDALQALALELCTDSVNRCLVLVLAEDDATLVPAAGSVVVGGRPAPWGDLGGLLRPAWGPGSACRRVLRTGVPEAVVPARAQAFASCADDDRTRRLAGGDEDVQLVVMPLAVEGRALGVVVFGGDQRLDLLRLEPLAHRTALTVRCLALERTADEERSRRRLAEQRLDGDEDEVVRAGWGAPEVGEARVEDGVVVRVSPALGRILGHPPEAGLDLLVGRPLDELLECDLDALATSPRRRPTGTGTAGPHRGEVRRPDGSRVHVQLEVQPAGGRHGERRAHVLRVTELTSGTGPRWLAGQQRVLDALARGASSTVALDAIARLLEEVVPSSVVTVRLDDALDGRTIASAAPSSSDHGPEAPLGVSLRSGRFGATWSAQVHAGGQVVGHLVVDIAARRGPTAVEQRCCEDAVRLAVVCARLQRLAAHQHVLLDAVSDGVVILDEAGVITEVNGVAEGLLGWSAKELVGRPFHETLHHSCVDGSPSPAERSMVSRSLREGIAAAVRGDVFWSRSGSLVVVDHTCTPLGNQSGVAVVFAAAGARLPTGFTPSGVLTEREREVLSWIAQGVRGEEAARRMFISTSTLQSHLKNALAKLGASGRANGVVLALARGELDLPQLVRPAT